MKTSFSPPAHPPTPQPLARTQGPREFSAQYRAQSQEMAITLTTKEGDRITIRQDASTAQRSVTAQGDGSLLGISQGLATAGMTVELEGDLSYQELNDLIGLFKDLSGIASDFFSGNLDEAIAGAADIGDMGSITELSATFSRTTVLAEYLQGPHPLPTLFEPPEDLLLAEPGADDDRDPQSGPVPSSGLPALWQQFLGALIELDAPPTPPPPLPTPDSAPQAGERMLARSRETMGNHPRLAPLMPSMAGLAIEQASRLFDQGQQRHHLTKDLHSAFRTAFNDWVV